MSEEALSTIILAHQEVKSSVSRVHLFPIASLDMGLGLLVCLSDGSRLLGLDLFQLNGRGKAKQIVLKLIMHIYSLIEFGG